MPEVPRITFHNPPVTNTPPNDTLETNSPIETLVASSSNSIATNIDLVTSSDYAPSTSTTPVSSIIPTSWALSTTSTAQAEASMSTISAAPDPPITSESITTTSSITSVDFDTPMISSTLIPSITPTSLVLSSSSGTSSTLIVSTSSSTSLELYTPTTSTEPISIPTLISSTATLETYLSTSSILSTMPGEVQTPTTSATLDMSNTPSSSNTNLAPSPLPTVNPQVNGSESLTLALNKPIRGCYKCSTDEYPHWNRNYPAAWFEANHGTDLANLYEVYTQAMEDNGTNYAPFNAAFPEVFETELRDLAYVDTQAVNAGIPPAALIEATKVLISPKRSQYKTSLINCLDTRARWVKV